MIARRVAVVFDDRLRPETTGAYVLRAFQELTTAAHLRPEDTRVVSSADFDLFVRVDDGLEYDIPAALRPLAWWAIDTHLDFLPRLAQAARADWTFAAQKPGADRLRRSGIDSAEWLPLACDPAAHRPHDLPKAYDVCFVGTECPGSRGELLDLLRKEFASHFIGQLFFDDMARAYSASRVVFNRSIRDDLNMRAFEALACGSLLATNDLPESGQNELFSDGVHLAVYRDPAELLDKIRYYLAHADERVRVEQAGRCEVLERHTYRHRVERILTAAERRAVSVTVPALPVGYHDFDRPELRAAVPDGARDILDVGCGSGRLGEALKVADPARRVVGVEYDPAAAARARTRLDEVIVGDAEGELPFTLGSFDAVVCGDVLEHLRDPLQFLRRVRDWLRPGGTVVVSLPNVRHHTVVRGLLGGDWTYEPAGLLDATHLRFFTRREAEKLLSRAGFDRVEATPLPGPGYGEWDRAGRPGAVHIDGLQITGLEPAEAEEFFAYQWRVVARSRIDPSLGLTSIVVLVHNELAYTRQCLDSVRFLTDEPFELIVVDNGSTDGTPDYLRHLASADPRVRVITNPVNRGFPAAANQGIRAARGDQILLLNNDTVATTGWLSRLLAPLRADPSIGLVGPCSNRVGSEQQIPVTYGDDLVGLDGFAWQWAAAHRGQIEDTDRLIGFCLLIRRTVIEAVGELDEQFGVGCYEDDDYCRRAARQGFRAVIARDAFVHHFGSRTFLGAGFDLAAIMADNGARFKQKWPSPDFAVRPTPPPGPSPSQDGRMQPVSADPGGGPSSSDPAIRLSGCLIVRDNERTIRACLESLRPWVDELVVVDTGSTDATPQIAVEVGARVFDFPWCDDFAAARNESLRHARGAWAFWMDSDDTIDEFNGQKLRALANQDPPAPILGYVMQVRCPGAGESGSTDVTVVDHVKLFRNRPDLRFEGRIHEQILPAIRRAGGEVRFTDVFVTHSGYDHSPAGQARKAERDLRLLHLELTERPDHPFTLFNLGMTYADLGRYEEAIGWLNRCLARSGSGESHVRKAYALLVAACGRAGRADEAMTACDRGLELFPDDVELRFRRAVLLHQVGRFREAAAVYRGLLRTNGPRHFASRDQALTGFKARQNLAIVYADLGQMAQAERQWRAVVREAPGYRTGWRGLVECLLARGKLDEASQLATSAAGLAPPGEPEYIQAQVLHRAGRLGDAGRYYREAAALVPDDPEPLRALGRLLFEAGEFADAEAVLGRLASVNPDDPAAAFNHGAALLHCGRSANAVEVLRRADALRPNHPATLALLAEASRHCSSAEQESLTSPA